MFRKKEERDIYKEKEGNEEKQLEEIVWKARKGEKETSAWRSFRFFSIVVPSCDESKS